MKKRASRQHGFSLIELLISLTVFVVIAGAVASTLMASSALNRVNKESLRAMEAAESAIEALKGTTFSEVFARYNVDGADDPAPRSSISLFVGPVGTVKGEGPISPRHAGIGRGTTTPRSVVGR